MNKSQVSLRSVAVVLALAGSAAFAQAPNSQSASDPVWQQFLQLRRDGHKEEAMKYLIDAADKGNPNAEMQMGEEYRGADIDLAGTLPLDDKKAFYWTKKAVDDGNKHALTDLGVDLIHGTGTQANPAEGQKYLAQATEGGDMKAARYLASSYEEGIGGKPDYQKAIQYYRLSADRGDTTGMCMLGTIYQRGVGVDKNADEAAQWYAKSSQRGDRVSSSGMVAMGYLFETRADGKKSLQSATDWYKKAADTGNMVAKAQLERLDAHQPPPADLLKSVCGSAFVR
jgi:TPR repeat protein